MKDYLKNSFNKSINERKEYYLYDIPVYMLQKMPKHIDINDVLEEIKEVIPYDFYSTLEGIYIGDFPDLKDRDIQAMLKDGAIYLSTFKEFPDVTEEVIVKHILHEIAHIL